MSKSDILYATELDTPDLAKNGWPKLRTKLR